MKIYSVVCSCGAVNWVKEGGSIAWICKIDKSEHYIGPSNGNVVHRFLIKDKLFKKNKYCEEILEPTEKEKLK
jgi:hypothetical protein